MEKIAYNIKNNKKICLLTDIHYDIPYDFTIFDKIKEDIIKEKPDYICMVGDIIDDSSVIIKDTRPLIDFIKNLSLISQVIITLGNHELRDNKYDVINFFENIKLENVYFLNNKSLIRDNICFIGFSLSKEYYEKENVNTFIKEFNEKVDAKTKYYNILLCHTPINILKDKTIKKCPVLEKIDLILSGHMHNGLRLISKGNRGIISPTKALFPKYSRGMFKKTIGEKEITMIVSGGIVKLSNTRAKIFRIFNKLYPHSIVYINI